MILPIEVLIALLVWGTLVGVDLVSLPQMMIARPLVAGTVAGAILGDIPTGLRLGVVFELLQYDILPVGAVRYPEYGPATVAAVATAHAAPGGEVLGLGLGALVGLVTALVGGVTINGLRRLNSRIVHAAAATLESGDPGALVRVHVGGLLRDGLRAALVTSVGLVLAWLARPLLAGALAVRDGRPALLLAAVVVAAGLAAGAAGPLRLRGTGAQRKWVAGAARAEHDGAPPDQIERLREALCGPLGSLGDRLVWAGWLPLLSGLTIAAIALGAGWFAVAGFLIVYNIGHVALRWWALNAGWTYGARVSVALHSPMLQKALALLGPAMAFAVGFALPLAARFLAVPFPRWGQLAAVVTAGGGCLGRPRR